MKSPTWVSPPGYLVTDDGIKKVTTDKEGGVKQIAEVSPLPLNLVCSGLDAQGEQYLTLVWRSNQRVVERTLPRADVYNGKLQTLAAYGAPISDANKPEIQRFLMAQEGDPKRPLPEVRILTEGWSKDFSSYVLGSRVIGDPGRCYLKKDDKFIDALQPRGHQAQYKKVVEQIRDSGPVAEMCWAAGYVGPLIRPLNRRSTTFSLWGPSGSGKSALQALAVSPWGTPEDIKLTADISDAALTSILGQRNDFILWIDDTQQTRTEDLLKRMAYTVGSGKSGERLTSSGQRRASHQWRTFVLVSGERPILDMGADAGAQRRSLELYAEPMDELKARNLHHELSDHHGWTGPIFVEHLLGLARTPEGRQGLIGMYYQLEQQLSAEMKDELASHVALVTLANMLARVWVFGEDSAAAQEHALATGRTILQMAVDERQGVGTKAFEEESLLDGWVTANYAGFETEQEPHTGPKLLGRVTKDEIAILASEFLKFLKEHNLNRRAFLSRVEKRVLKGTAQTTKNIRFRSTQSQAKCYCFSKLTE